MQIPLTTQNVVKAQRLGSIEPSCTRQLIVKFDKGNSPEMFLQNRKQPGNTEQYKRVVISEDLTKTRYDIHRKMQTLKRDNKVHEVWSYNDSIQYKLTHSEVSEIEDTPSKLFVMMMISLLLSLNCPRCLMTNYQF